MGKLHTLRRAIERDPKRWSFFGGAYFWKGKWEPSYSASSYRAFVTHVLKGILGR